MLIPQVKILLPELDDFALYLLEQCQNHQIDDWPLFTEQVRGFYTSPMMDKFERVIPGWIKMSSYTDQQTLIHVTSVLTALFALPEFKQSPPVQQSQMIWVVLFHDVAKVAELRKHDYVHAFRSAAIAGKALAGLGFPVTTNYPDLIDEWVTLTNTAVVNRADLQAFIQDNSKLSAITMGIDRLYGEYAPATQIIKAVLLHISIVNDPGYPTVAPLTDDQVRQYIDHATFPLLKMMMLVDTDGWCLFDPENRQRLRHQTLEVFDAIGTLIGI